MSNLNKRTQPSDDDIQRFDLKPSFSNDLFEQVLQRENLGAWKSRNELDGELNKWIRQYVADQESPSAATRSQRPLRKAMIEVSEVPGEAGWYQVSMSITPHFKFMGASFTLSLFSMLEKA